MKEGGGTIHPAGPGRLFSALAGPKAHPSRTVSPLSDDCTIAS